MYFLVTRYLWNVIAFSAAVNHNYCDRQRTMNKSKKRYGSKSTYHKWHTWPFVSLKWKALFLKVGTSMIYGGGGDKVADFWKAKKMKQLFFSIITFPVKFNRPLIIQHIPTYSKTIQYHRQTLRLATAWMEQILLPGQVRTSCHLLTSLCHCCSDSLKRQKKKILSITFLYEEILWTKIW